ncbi:oligosaccharide flippase family protein [Methylobacterium sp. J-077]|uniref:oligosaccharide flippase family protein n=1 Tax=Methylobacterium sp. J-077 TaxID=2836656 RepID=UPI001FBBA812|nr:oligosaccharide flippase family protein [Methylobacterium sp. J-077]MCJ2121689.1 oligosaccharide flippase family protein [Methylobacterium sp. J-077]
MNVITLTIWQGSIYLIPLITTPYLARVLGVQEFGWLGLAGAVVSYISLVVDWGFSLSATQKVAQNSGQVHVLRQLFWDVVLAKFILVCVMAAIFLLFILFFPDLKKILPIVLAFLLQVIFGVLNASWLLQGLERMMSFALASLAGRVLTIPLTFVFVHGPDDVVVAAAIQGGSFSISAIASLWAAGQVLDLRPVTFSPARSCQQIRDGASLFLSTGGISLYSQGNVLVLGAISGATAAGLYSGADRVRRAVQGVTGPVSTALFPRVNNLVVTNPLRAKTLIGLILLVQGGGTFFLSLGQYFAADFVVTRFLGPAFVDAVPVVQALAPIPFLVGLSNVFGMQMLIPLGFSRSFTIITLGAGFCSLIFLPILCFFHGAVGAAVAATVTEGLVTTMMALVLFVRRKTLFAKPEPVPEPAAEILAPLLLER